MKLAKLTFAEFFKALKRPGIFAMIATLAVALFVCAIAYKPTPKANLVVSLTGNNVAEINSKFSSDPAYKTYYDNTLLKLSDTLTYYETIDKNKELLLLKTKIEEIGTEIVNLNIVLTKPIFNSDEAHKSMKELRARLSSSLDYFNNFFKQNNFILYADNVALVNTRSIINKTLGLIPENITAVTKTWYSATLNSINNNNLHSNALIFTNSLSVISYDVKKMSLEKKYIENFNKNWLTDISTNIHTFVQTHALSKDVELKAELNNLYTEYIYASNAMITHAQNTIQQILKTTKSDTELQSLFGFENYNDLYISTNIARAEFQIKNKLIDTNFQSVSGFNKSSYFEKNAFDFAFFCLEIAALIIMIFTVVFAANMVAGEQSAGTMKMLAIRPYSRSKIVMSKFFATTLIALAFLIISFTISITMGFISFGSGSLPLLGVFNGQTAFLISPYIYSLVAIAFLFLKIAVFLSFAILISVIFRSNVGSVLVSLISYVGVLVLNTTLCSYPFYRFIPFANFDLLKYFGGGEISGGQTTNLISIFSSPLYNNTTFWTGFIMTLSTILILNITSVIIFKKKDIA